MLPSSIRSKPYVVLISSIAALGGLLFGYDTGVIAGAILFLERHFQLNPSQVGWAASCALLGCVLGAACAGILSDRYGRLKALVLSALLLAVSALFSAIPEDMTTFAMARIVGGLGVGMASALSPMYIAEVAPAHLRGRLVSLNQLAIVIGFFVVYFINAGITRLGDLSWNVAMGWRWMFASELLPSVLFLLLLFFVPESPRWFVKAGRSQEAHTILERVNGEEEAQKQLKEIERTIQEEASGSLTELFSGGLKALLIGIVLSVLQQFGGINAIMYYAPRILEGAGASLDAAMVSTVVVGTVNLLFTFVALALIDRFGRKPLMIVGCSGMAVALFGMGAMFAWRHDAGLLLLPFILLYIASFAASMGPVVWVVLAEIYPNRLRGRAVAITTAILWAANYVVSQSFPMMLESLGKPATFGVYMIANLLAVLFVWHMVPETKGHTLEEIEASW